MLRPPWGHVTRQIYLGGPAFLERIERLVRGKSVANVPTAQATPTRLSPGAILQHVAAIYRVPATDILARTHREAY